VVIFVKKFKLALLFPLILLGLTLILVACTGDPTGTSQPKPNFTPTPVFTPTPSIVLPPTPTAMPLFTPDSNLPRNGSIVGAHTQAIKSLHPYKENSEASSSYLNLLFAASLTKRNPANLVLEANAAEKWTVDNAQATVTFTLKPNLKWSDGRPLTSFDYLQAYQQARKPENKWQFASAAFAGADYPNSSGIEIMTAPDPRVLMVKLKSYSFDMVNRADVIQPLPAHIWQTLDWNDPAKNPEINKPSVVSGAWLLKEWKVGEQISFSRNPNSSLYPVPLLENLTFKLVADPQVARELLRRGEIDFFSPPANEQAEFEKLTNIQAYKWNAVQTTWQYVGFNFRTPLLQDKAVRQALVYATDRKTILDKFGFGLGQVSNSEVPVWHPYYYDNTEKYAFNLAKAKEILQKAGYSLQNGQLLAKNNQPLPPLRLVYNTPSQLREGIAETIRQNYAALGIRLKVQTFSHNDYVDFLTTDNSGYDLFIGGWQTDFDPENFGEVWRNVPELNNGAYRNEKVFNLYSSALAEPDSTKRRVLLAQVQQLQAQELPYIFLFAGQGWLNVNKRIGGIKPTLLGVTYNLYTDWYIK
jgi:peptide/nickel transport system substrate-binding protein